MKRKLLTSSLMLAGLCNVMSGHAAGPHVHGTAKMQVAIDGNSMEVELAFPLESLIGFEHAPHNDRERKAVQHMMGQLNNPKTLLVPAAAAQCTVGKTEINAPSLESRKKNPNGHAKHEEEHAELEAMIPFHCAVPAALRSMEVRLFDVFPRLQRLQAEVAAPGRQSAATLSRERRNLSW